METLGFIGKLRDVINDSKFLIINDNSVLPAHSLWLLPMLAPGCTKNWDHGRGCLNNSCIQYNNVIV